jgi:hypothetical protein
MNPTTGTFIEQADLFSHVNSTCRLEMPVSWHCQKALVVQISWRLAPHRLLPVFWHEYVIISGQRKLKERGKFLVDKNSNKGLTLSPVIIS